MGDYGDAYKTLVYGMLVVGILVGLSCAGCGAGAYWLWQRYEVTAVRP